MYRVLWVYGTRSDVLKMRFVTLPLTPSLLVREPGEAVRYVVLPEEEPKPPPRGTGRGQGSWGAQPRRAGRPIEPLAE
jgi:hypothetical protein